MVCTCYKKPLDDDFNYNKPKLYDLSKIQVEEKQLYIIVETINTGGHSSSIEDRVTYCSGIDAVNRFIMSYHKPLSNLQIFKADKLNIDITLN